jgi:hypothetical protein
MMPGPYPHIPIGAKTGLIVFGCGDGVSRNDVPYFQRSHLETTIVDNHQPYIDRMQAELPEWTYVNSDAFRFLSDAILRQAKWDVVSVDPYTNQAAETFGRLFEWPLLARELCVVGVQRPPPHLYTWNELPRNDKWSWLYTYSCP